MKDLHDAKAGDVVKFVGPINAQILPYEHFLVIGFVEEKAVLARLRDEDVDSTQYLRDLSDSLASDLDCSPKYFQYFEVIKEQAND